MTYTQSQHEIAVSKQQQNVVHFDAAVFPLIQIDVHIDVHAGCAHQRHVLRYSGDLVAFAAMFWLCCVQGGVHGAIILQGPDQGVRILTSADHDSWRCISQHPVHARGGLPHAVPHLATFIFRTNPNK